MVRGTELVRRPEDDTEVGAMKDDISRSVKLLMEGGLLLCLSRTESALLQAAIDAFVCSLYLTIVMFSHGLDGAKQQSHQLENIVRTHCSHRDASLRSSLDIAAKPSRSCSRCPPTASFRCVGQVPLMPITIV